MPCRNAHRARALAGALAGLLLTLAAGAHAASVLNRPGEVPGTPPDVHFGFTVGTTGAHRWQGLDSGYSVSMRFEVETTAWFSPFVEGTLCELSGERPSPNPYYPMNHLVANSRAVSSLGVGARVRLPRGGPLRPTAEAGVMGRFVSDGSYIPVAHADNHLTGDPAANHESGQAGFVRLGVTTARPHGAGLFADAGWEFLVRDPARNGLLPLRVGILFP